jgi:hypothetical protein
MDFLFYFQIDGDLQAVLLPEETPNSFHENSRLEISGDVSKRRYSAAL